MEVDRIYAIVKVSEDRTKGSPEIHVVGVHDGESFDVVASRGYKFIRFAYGKEYYYISYRTTNSKAKLSACKVIGKHHDIIDDNQVTVRLDEMRKSRYLHKDHVRKVMDRYLKVGTNSATILRNGDSRMLHIFDMREIRDDVDYNSPRKIPLYKWREM